MGEGLVTEPTTAAGRALPLRIHDDRIRGVLTPFEDINRAILAIEAEAAARPSSEAALREALDKAWRELELDALASDGPIRDADVKNAIKRNRPRIEAALATPPLPDATGLVEALEDIKAILDRDGDLGPMDLAIRDVLRRSLSPYLPSADDVRGILAAALTPPADAQDAGTGER